MRIVLAAAAALLATVGSAGAQGLTPVPRPTEVVPSVALSDITPVLREAGFDATIQMVEGRSVLFVEVENKRIQMHPRACKPTGGCAGLWMFALIQDQNTLSHTNIFNRGSKPARATMVEGRILLDRYLIADYGITRGSLVTNVGVFAAMIDQWFEYAKTNGPVAVSFAPIMSEAPGGDSFVDHDMRDIATALAVKGTAVNTKSTISPLGAHQ